MPCPGTNRSERDQTDVALWTALRLLTQPYPLRDIMPLTLRITCDDGSGPPCEKTFGDETITIGRENSNSLLLSSNRVSRRHAKVEFHDGAFEIQDLQTVNGTYVNGRRLPASTPHKLAQGDRLKVGDCLLEVLVLNRASLTPPPILVEPSGQPTPRPETGDDRRREAEHLEELMRAHAREKSILAAHVQQLEQECERLKSDHRVLSAVGTEQPALMLEILKILLRSFVNHANARSMFFNEFIGETHVRDRALQTMLDDPDGCVHFLLDTTIPEAESLARRKALERELMALGLHDVALLDGYRRSVDDGAHKILQEVNPRRLSEQVAATVLRVGPLEFPYKYIPLLVEFVTGRRIRTRLLNLIKETRGILERKYFRQAFVQGYESRVARGPGEAHQEVRNEL
jgi:hypothetical protein